MLTLGIDLATQAKRTGLCSIEWEEGEARVQELSLGWQDASLLQQIALADKTGVDAPLGWPARFVSAVSAHQGEAPFWSLTESGEEQRKALALRITDKKVQEITGKRPLSASTDLISMVAFRLARIEQGLRYKGTFFSRDGSGAICEVYPGAALLQWGISPKGYKGKEGQECRKEIIGKIAKELPSLSITKAEKAMMEQSDDLLDAFIASLSARAAATGRTAVPEEADLGAAQKEGWIHLPTCPLSHLAKSGQ